MGKFVPQPKTLGRDIPCLDSPKLARKRQKALSARAELHAKRLLRAESNLETPIETQADGAPLFRISDLSAGYDKKVVVEGVDLEVRAGDVVALIGPNGSGKSTILKTITRHLAPLAGAVELDGREISRWKTAEFARNLAVMLTDRPRTELLTCRDIVEAGRHPYTGRMGTLSPDDHSRVDEAMKTAHVEELAERDFMQISDGQRQRVMLARAIAQDPRVLVLDEPTAALDPASSTLVFETLREANRALGITIVVVEQKVALLSEYCNRVLVLNHGEIALQGEPHEVFAHTDELRAIGVDCPRVTRIFNSLEADGLASGSPCLDVDEAERLITGIVDPAHASSDTQAPAGSPHAPSLRPHAKDAEPVLTFNHVEFAYPNGGAAVHDLSLTLYPGELVGIVGQNGAGKTTLTKLLTGLLKPASGSVRVTGLDTATVPTSRIAREVATLFQNPDRQICKDTVLDEVAFGLELAGIDRAEALRRAQLVIDRFGLPADEAPFSLSRGQRQMVALASVVVVEPKIVVLDEPTSGLDYRECMTVMETVRTMAERGCAVIMVCHDMEVVSDFAERIVVMADGRILDRGRTHELFSNIDLMRRAYVEPPQVIELSRRLTSSVSPAFAQVSEVTDIVRITEEMVHRG